MVTIAPGIAGISSTSPVAVPAPMSLTAEQRAAYGRDGFVVVSGVFAPQELETIDQEIDRLLTIPGNDAGAHRTGWIMEVARRSEITRQFAEDERLLSLIQEIVQPGVAIHSTKLVTKLPHSEEICHWHQDEAFYRRPDDPETHSQTRMSVWVPLQAATLDNGCLWVVPGSHTWGIEDYTMVQTGTCRKRIDREAYANEHAISVPVAAGSAVLFSAWTWHHSKGNQTNHVRRAFIVSYQEATLAKGAGEQWKILRPA
jgi:phytanoyl-CoA hydroxylase